MKDVIARLQKAVEEYKRRNNLQDYLLKANSPASDPEIEKLEEHLKIALPSSYREFLLMYNGYNGLACPGSMLSIQEIIDSPNNQRIADWKRDTSEYSGEDISHVIVFADQVQPNDWAYFDPKKINGNGEWKVILNLGGDIFESDDLLSFLESRIKFCEFRNDQ